MRASYGPGTILKAVLGMLIRSSQQPSDTDTILVTVLGMTNKEAKWFVQGTIARQRWKQDSITERSIRHMVS